MATLQKSILLNAGETDNVSLDVVFQVPQFRYFTNQQAPTSESGKVNVFREKTGYVSLRTQIAAGAKKYFIDVPAIGTVIEENDSNSLYVQYHQQLSDAREIDIDDVSFKIPVIIRNANTGEELARQELEAFDLFKYSRKVIGDIGVAAGVNAIDNRAAFLSVDDFVFFINKDAFSRLVDELNIGHHSQGILQIIAMGFSYQQKQPVFKFPEGFEEYLTNALYTLFPRYNANQQEIPENVEKVKRFVTAIKRHGNSLFDFPLRLSEVLGEAVEVTGDLTVVTNDTNVPASSLEAYELSLEYNNGQIVKTLYHNWNTAEQFIENKAIDFKFQVRERISQMVKVAVKGVNGELLWQQEYTSADSEIGGGEKIHIRVPLKKANTIPGGHSSNTQANKKLRGRVIQQGNKYNLNNITVLVQGKKEGDTVPRILTAGQTDSSGNFTLTYPYGNYIEAKALVALMPNSPVNIDIRADKENETISDDFLYILLVDEDVVPEDEEEGDDDDCDCHSPKKAKRLPDQEDLVNSDEYTQDIGGSCVNLTTPNRTLKEYAYKAIVRTSDPDVANYTLEKIQQGDNLSFRLTGGTQTIPRNKVVNLQNPIRWQDAPDAHQNLSFYQAVSVATGHILHYKTVFKSDGYSLGDLLYSLPLAPGQKKQIVIFDSSHSLTGAESQTISQSESLTANLINDRSIIDQIGGGISESMDGRSSASTAGISAGLGLGGSLGPISGVLGVSGGYSNSNSSASQDSSRNISQFFSEKLRQSISQNADSYRQLNASVVTTVKEGQQYAVATEAVANHNHCHALTMMYFEVLRHYAVFQELAAVEECVFVPLLMTNFTYENIYKWKDVLVNHLLPVNSNTYLQPISFFLGRYRHPLLKAFDAIERIQTNYSQVDYPLGQYADERMTEITGKINLRVNIPRPKTRFDRILSFPVIKKTITSRGDVDVAGTISDNIKDSIVGAIVPCAAKGPSIKYETNSTEVLTRGAIFDIFMTLDANYESVPPAQCIRVNFDAIDMFENPLTLVFNGDITPTPMDFFAGMNQEKALWEAYATILGMSVKELFKYFNNNVVADWDRIFNEHIAPLIFERLLNTSTGQPRLKLAPLAPIDLSPQGKYHGGERIIEVKLRGTTSLRRSDVHDVTITYSSPLSGTSKHDTFFNFVTFQAESVRIDYATEFSNNTILTKSLQDDLRDNILPIPTPLNAQEKRNPRKEDQYVAKQLIQHLNSNIEHYNRTLWFNLDTERRFMLMDGFSIQIYNEFGNPIGYRSLASVIKNQLITVTGNSLVFPVAEGYRVSKSYVVEMDNEQETAVSVSEALFNHYKPLTPAPPYRISVPNRGVFLEAVQGSCDACEKVKPNSSQDWDKFKTEEPTSIAPVVTPTPVVTDWKAVFKEFAQPIVNIQNAPATPAPGAGLAGLSELMGKAGIFNDITGLAGNQQNAMQTYLSNQENVKALAEMAKGMAMQEHNTANSDTIMSSLNNARESGAITPAQHSDLVSRHLEHQIDGGDARRSEAETAREASRPSLAAAAIEAAGDGRTVTAARTDADGNTESVAIGDTDAADSTGSVALVNNTSDLRAFHSGANDKTGVIAVQANVTGISGPVITWQNVGTGLNVDFSNANSVNTDIRGLIPGLHQVRISARSGTATGAARTFSFTVCVPQYIRITENATKFNAVLDGYQVGHLKTAIVEEMKATCDSILRTVNVRTIWQLGGFNETVPAHIPAANISVLEILDVNPDDSSLLGHADPHNTGWGPGHFNERLELYPGAYILPANNPEFGVDTETQALVQRLQGMTMSDPDMEAFAIKVFGRLIGETMAHEIIHTIIGLISTSPGNAHNPTTVANDIMNRGGTRSFTNRTGLVDNAQSSPVDPSTFTDNGIAAINRLQSANQARVDAVFPVNPA